MSHPAHDLTNDAEAGFEFKDLVKYVSEISKKYFLNKFNNI
jgi:hypothetical protein